LCDSKSLKLTSYSSTLCSKNLLLREVSCILGVEMCTFGMHFEAGIQNDEYCIHRRIRKMDMRTKRDPKTRRNNVHVTPQLHRELMEVADFYEISLKRTVKMAFDAGWYKVGAESLLRSLDEKANLQKDQETTG